MVTTISLAANKKALIIILIAFLSVMVSFFVTNYFSYSVYSSSSIVQFTAEEENMTALEITERYCKGSIQKEFPEDFRSKTIKEIRKLAQGKGELARKAKKAWKLLTDKRFRKP